MGPWNVRSRAQNVSPPPPKVNYVTYACIVHNVIMYQWIYIYELYDCMYDSSIFTLHYITTKFLSKHCIKWILDTKMNVYHCFNFTEKTFLQSVDPKE